jgi:23S rRNA (cytidine1920-2'-O)/16S rRNA (cytidine1409-2'-O)-methyltransferase
VRDETVARAIVDDIAEWLKAEMGWAVDGIIASPIEGGDGNREYLVGARRG